jgi:hypothetical protein
MRHCRAAGVKHGRYADPCAQVFGTGRDRDHRLGRCLEQDIVDESLVLIRDFRDRAGQRVDDLEVWHREQLGFPLFQPLPPRRTLALRAMPVAVAVVRDNRVRATLAASNMAAECDYAAALDRTHDLYLVEPEWPALARRHAAPCSRKMSATSSSLRKNLVLASF